MNRMNPSRHTGFGLLLGGVITFLSAVSLQAAATNQITATNAIVAVSTNDYRSVFDGKGRDPFFPNSIREAAEPTEGGESQSATILVLKGISGASSRRFAIINDHTFAVGEESEVITAGGRVRIRCVEIRDNVAVVTIGSGGQKIELRLPSRF